MKKFYLGALCCLLAMGSSAQIQTMEPIATLNRFFSLEFIHGKFTKNGEGMPFTGVKEGNIYKIHFFDKAFNIFKTIEMPAAESDEYIYFLENPYFIDVESGAEFSDYSEMYVTQTLFNNDEKWEFFRGKRDKDWNISELDIVSEDGTIIASFPYIGHDGEAELKIGLWGENTYLIINNSTKAPGEDRIWYSDIYLIDREANSVKKIASTPAMRAIPALAERNSTVNVTLDAETVKNGGELIITDSNGRTVGRSYVEAGQTSVPVTTDRMGSGVYNITLTEKGQKVENARIIVK